MTFYLLLNLALIIVAAGFIPVFALATDGDDPAARKKQQEDLRLIDELIKNQVEGLRKKVAEQVKFNAVLDDTKTASEQNLELLSNELRILKRVLEEAQKRDEVDKDQLAILKEQVGHLERQEKALGASTNAADAFGRSFDKLLGLSDTWNTSMVGGLLDSVAQGRDFKGTLDDIGDRLKKNIQPTRLIGNLVTKVQDATFDLMVAQDRAITSVNKSTQAYGKYDDQMADVHFANRTMGVDMEKVASSVMSLNSAFTTFDLLSKSVQNELIETSAQLQVLGADAGLAAEAIKMATTNLGMSALGANDLRKEIVTLAGDLNMDLNKALGDFNAAAPFLAQYGNDAKDAFMELAVAADNLSMDMSRLISIVDEFATFEGAANAAGRLNAALGGDFLNSVSLMSASFDDPVDALRQLREGILAGVGSFDSMGAAQKRMIAEAAGLSSVGELSQLLAGDLEAQQIKTDANALSQEELNRRMAASQDIAEQWKNTLSSLAITMLPVVKGLRALIEGFNTGIRKLDDLTEGVGGLGTVLSTLGVAFVAFKAVIIPVSGLVAGIGTSLATSTAAAAPAATGLTSFARVLAVNSPFFIAAAKGLGALGLGIGAVGLGFGVIAVALGSVVADFKSLVTLDMSGAILNLIDYTSEIASFGITASYYLSDVLALAAAFGALAVAASQLNLDGLKPIEETIKAVVVLEKLDGTPQVDRLIQQIVQLNEVRAAAPKPAPKGADKSAPQIAFPEKLKLVIGTKNGADREFDAYINMKIDKRAPGAIKGKMVD